MDEEMTDEQPKTETVEENKEGAEMQGEGDQGEGEETVKTEEEIEQELKETQISISRYAPHVIPQWSLEEMRERWKWHIRIHPIDQEDCRNCILDAATKIAQESWYYVPKRKNGQGTAELCMISNSEAHLVMARVVRMPFYHRYITIEVTRREQENTAGEDQTFTKVEETATILFDSTKSEKIKNTASSRGSYKRRNLWVRYVSENTSKEMLRVLFPLSQSVQLQTHDNLRLGLVEANSKTDVLIFIKSYLTVTINGLHVMALQNKEPGEEVDSETEIKQELELTMTALNDLELAPVEVADRSEQRKDDKNQTSRVLKRTLHQQQRLVENRRREQMGNKRSRGEPPAKRGGWGDGRNRSGRFGGSSYGGRGGHGAYGGGMMDPQGMAAEMMMMQAQLNQTIQNQLMMLNPNQRTGGGGGYGGGGRFGGGRRGGRGGGGRK